MKIYKMTPVSQIMHNRDFEVLQFEANWPIFSILSELILSKAFRTFKSELSLKSKLFIQLNDFFLHFFIIVESKKDSSSTQLKEAETKLKKSLDENKTFNDKVKQLEEKISKQDFEVRFLLTFKLDLIFKINFSLNKWKQQK